MAKKRTVKTSPIEDEQVGELGDNGVSAADAAAHVENKDVIPGQSPEQPAAKKRTAYYMVMSMSKYGTADSVLGTFRSQRAAEKWLISNRVLISKIAEQIVLVRARNVTPRM